MSETSTGARKSPYPILRMKDPKGAICEEAWYLQKYLISLAGKGEAPSTRGTAISDKRAADIRAQAERIANDLRAVKALVMPEPPKAKEAPKAADAKDEAPKEPVAA